MAGGSRGVRRKPTLRALVVDDHDAGRVLAKLILERFGLVVDDCADAESCAARVEAARYDLILVDRVLGEDDGLALGVRLAMRTGAAVVMVSGLTPPETVPAVLAGWLCKPYSPRQMYGVVSTALAGHGKMLAYERIL